VPCASGSPNCGANGFLTGYNAGSGYDLASGLGSVDATLLVQNWSKLAFKASTVALQLNGSTNPISIVHGTSVAVAASVTGAGGTPTGSIALITSSTAPGNAVDAVQFTQPSPSVFSLTNGSVTGTDANLPGSGSTPYQVFAQYGGDGTFSPGKSNAISVTVTPEASTLSLAIEDFQPNGQGQDASTASTPSVTYGTWISVNAQPLSTVQANGSPDYYSQATGSVKFNSSSPTLNLSVPINSNGFAEIPNQTNFAYPPGSYTVSASYAGDPSFTASTAPSQSFVVAQASTSMAAANGSANGTLAVEVDPVFGNLLLNNGTALPSGTVTVKTSTGTAIGTGVLAAVQTQQGVASGATVTLDVTKLGVGANNLTVNYPGDGNYTGSALANFNYNYTPGGGTSLFTLSAAPSTITVPSGGSASTTMNIAPQGGFKGTVNVTCQVSGGTTSQPTCSLATPSVTISGTTAGTDKLTVTAVASSSATRTAANPSHATWYAAGGTALAGILLFGLPGRRRAWQRMLSLMLLIVAIGVVGCGGSSSSGGTPAGSYTVTVTATSGTATQTSTVTATVQ
jgi:hypothetical protein